MKCPVSHWKKVWILYLDFFIFHYFCSDRYKSSEFFKVFKKEI